jgi:hypothetical protein
MQQILGMRQEYECSRMKELRVGATPRRKRGGFRLSLRRR